MNEKICKKISLIARSTITLNTVSYKNSKIEYDSYSCSKVTQLIGNQMDILVRSFWFLVVVNITYIYEILKETSMR